MRRHGSWSTSPRWTEHQAREVLDTLVQSGQSVSAFASDHGLDPQRIYAWRRRLGRAEPIKFHELILGGSEISSTAPASEPFEIVLPNGEVVRVPASFDGGALARLLDVVARSPRCASWRW